MIVPMKKATILFNTGGAEETVKYLRAAGVLHVEHQNPPEGRDLSALQEKLVLMNSTLDLLSRASAFEKNLQVQDKISGEWTSAATHILDLGRQQEYLESESRNIISQINEWKRWGDVDLVHVEHLRKNGIYLRLFQVPGDETGSFPNDAVVKTIFTAGDIAHCVVISRGQFECAFKEILPPQHSVSVLRELVAGNNRALERIHGEINESVRFYQDFSHIKEKLEKEIQFQQVLSGMGKEGAIGYITGYIPSDREGFLISEARYRKWGIMTGEPSAEDNVPTLLHNPPWVSMIQPVLELLGITPGYREIDVSMLFLIFLGIFFGILVGDAGYGLVYILIALGIQKGMKLGTETKKIVSLFYLLGSCALLWGGLTGTFFGQRWLLDVGFRPLVPQLNDAIFNQSFCFFLGAFHLSIAHSLRAYVKLPSLKALADAGWICIIWTAFFLARTLILGAAFPASGTWLLTAGIVLVIVFTNPQVNVLRGIGDGLGTVALSLMNNFTDVISYVRLFAVGLATLAIAETTNTLASGMGEGAAAFAAGVVIIFFGHSLNIILGPMSVLVHGVRLNVLEFSGHANVTWSGFAFEPLRE